MNHDDHRVRRLVGLLPAVVLVGGLSVASVVDTLIGSVREEPSGYGFSAYRAVVGHEGFGASLWFSLRVAVISTVVSVLGAALIGFALAGSAPTRGTRTDRDGHGGRWTRVMAFNVGVAHVVWGTALAATLAPSGWLARVASRLGLIASPASFPLLVNDTHGIGIVMHLVSKELPFVLLVLGPMTGPLLRAQLAQAATLGAGLAARFRHVYVPAVKGALGPAAVAVFAFSLGSYEPAVLLGTQQPRTLAVVALDRFRDPDLSRRAQGFAIAAITFAAVFAVVAIVAVGTTVLGRLDLSLRPQRRDGWRHRHASVGMNPRRVLWLGSNMFAVGGVAVVVVPMLVLVGGAVSTRWFSPAVFPHELTFQRAWDLATRHDTKTAVMTGLVVSGIVAVVSVIVAWPAASVLHRRPPAVVSVSVLAVLVLPSVLPVVGLAIGVDSLLLRAGIAGTYPGVIVAHLVVTVPYSVALLSAVLSRVDPRLDQQMALLGASRSQRLRLVSVPTLASGVVVAGVLAFVVSWGQYLLTLLAGSGRIVTITMVLFASASGGNPTTIGTLAIMATIPALVAVVVAQRATTGRGR